MISSKNVYKHTSNLNVLYIDNNQDDRKSTIKTIKKFFKNVSNAKDSKEGLEKYIKYHKKNESYYDIVFIDISISQLNGHKLIDEIYYINPAQAIVVISDSKENNTLIKLIEQGIASFILKPLDNDILAKVLYKISNIILHGKISKKYATGMKKFNKLLKEKIKEEITKNTQKEIELLEQKHALMKEQEIQKYKDIFLAKMSHDIRTPLNAIIGFTNILQNTNLSKEQSDYMELISTSSNILSNIINDILDFSKIAEGKLDLDPKPANPKKEATNFLNIFKAQIEEKGLKFIINIDPNIPECMIYDKNRLKQIVMNLLGNAIKFTKKGSIEFKEELLSQKDGMATVKFTIKDTGIGIAKEKQKDIFKAFSQESKSTSTNYGGTGLGISIADELLKLYGGELKLHSEPNIGTEFYFTLEFEICNTKDLKEDKKQEINLCTFTDAHILVAEDNLINQELIKNILKGKNIKTTLANNGEEVIEIYKNNSDLFNMIFMDINMPVMGGLDALESIRVYEKKTKLIPIPIIALTANTIKGDKEKYMKLGMNDYLAKPITIDILDSILQKYLCHRCINRISQSDTKTQQISHHSSYNIQKVAKELEIEPSLAKKLLDTFFNKFNNQINEMKEALEQKDFETLNTLLHTAKGTSGNLRLTSIEELLCTLEIYSNKKDINFQWNTHFELLNKYTQEYKNQLK